MKFEAEPEKVVCKHTRAKLIFSSFKYCFVVISPRWSTNGGNGTIIQCSVGCTRLYRWTIHSGENFEWKKHLIYIIHQGVFIIVSSFSISAIAIDRCLAVGSALTALSARWSRCWMFNLDVGCWMFNLDVGWWIWMFDLDVGYWMFDLDVGYWMLDV